MNRRYCLCAALCLGAGISARAQDPSSWALEAGVSRESLTRGLPDWSSRYLAAERRTPEHGSLYAGWRQTQRYARDDREAHAGGLLPLGVDTQLQLEAGRSDSHRVLPAGYGLLQWMHKPAEGWTVGAGLRRSAYDLGWTRVANVNIDRYLGNERFGYSLYGGGPDRSGLSASHRLQWAHYYGDRDWIGLSLTKGQETEATGGARFLTSRVSAVSLSGRHSLAPHWSLIWDAGRQRQGDLYSRSGASLGLRRTF